jgi:hypothetical protein
MAAMGLPCGMLSRHHIHNTGCGDTASKAIEYMNNGDIY